MNKTGHTLDQFNDDDGFRQFEIKCFGPNDKRKYIIVDSFGSAYMPPLNTRVLVTDSSNKDKNFCIGVLNKLNLGTLNHGDRILFSTDEAGENIVSKIVMRNTGAIEVMATSETSITITGNAIINVDGDATIGATGNVNLNADGNVVATATQFSANGNLTVD